jgi:hypothetical protein
LNHFTVPLAIVCPSKQRDRHPILGGGSNLDTERKASPALY